MAGNPYFQDRDPQGAPDPVTPAGTPSDPAGYAKVTPAGTGPAPYDISAPQDIAGITAAVNAAGQLAGGAEGAATGAGVMYGSGPRQAEARAFLESPQGAPAMSVTSGFPDYENTDPSPGANMETPIQGHVSDYPGTVQAGVPQFGGDEGGALPATPPGGSMGAPGSYPGTTQDGLRKYGTS